MNDLQRLKFLSNIRENKEDSSEFVIKNLKNKTLENPSFREVVKTLTKIQVVVMTIAVGGKIDKEVHEDGDQLLYVMQGQAKVEVDNQKSSAYAGDCIAIPMGAVHEIVNGGETELKLMVFYAPPQH